MSPFVSNTQPTQGRTWCDQYRDNDRIQYRTIGLDAIEVSSNVPQLGGLRVTTVFKILFTYPY
jgi:hypothetical protein